MRGAARPEPDWRATCAFTSAHPRGRATGTLSHAPARQVITFVSRGTMEHRARHAKLIAAPVGPRLKAREKRAVATQNSQAGADWRFMGRASRHWRARSPRSQQGG